MRTFLLVLILIVCVAHLALYVILSLDLKPREYRAVDCSVVDMTNPRKTVIGTVLELHWFPEVTNRQFLALIQTEGGELCTAALTQEGYLNTDQGDLISLDFEGHYGS